MAAFSFAGRARSGLSTSAVQAEGAGAGENEVEEDEAIENGRIANNNLGEYKLPCIADIPTLKTVLVKSTGGVGPFDSKPIGEFANNAPPAAIANAIADAVGVRLFELPLTPEKIYRALKEKTATPHRQR